MNDSQWPGRSNWMWERRSPCLRVIFFLSILGVVLGLFGTVTFAADPVLVGQWPGGNRGEIQAAQVRSNLAYCAIGKGGLSILNVSNANAVTWVGGYTNLGSASDLVLDGTRAFVALYTAGLQVINVSNPANPVLSGTYTNCDRVKGIAKNGNFVLLADGTNGLQIINVASLPVMSRAGGYTQTNGFGEAVATSGTYAYLAMGSAGLVMVNISNPALPTRTGSYDTSGYAQGVAVSGNHVYVADGNWGLQIINVSNPTNLIRVGGYDTSGYAQAVAVAGNIAYVADSDGGFVAIDVSNPALPQLTDVYEPVGWPTSVALDGLRAYVGTGADLEVVDLSESTNLSQMGTYNSGGDAVGVAVQNGRAYVSDSLSGLHIVDVGDVVSPSRTGKISDWAFHTLRFGNNAFVATEAVGIQMVDLANDADPLLNGIYDSSGYAYASARFGMYACVAGANEGLTIVDFTTVAPVAIGTYNTTGRVFDVTVSGYHAFVADGSEGIQVISLTNPAVPVRIGGYNTSGRAEAVALAGTNLYVADGASGIHVIDVSDPANPVRVGRYDTPGFACGIALAGNLAYVADGTNGVQVLNISNSTNVIRVGGYDSPGFAEKVAVSGNYVFLADGPSGLKILKVYGFGSNPPQVTSQPKPQIVGLGEIAHFNVDAQGAEPLRYQWQLNGTNVDGATSATLSVSNITEEHVGAYTVVVTNNFGTVTSGAASLELVESPDFAFSGPGAPQQVANSFQFGLSTQTGVIYLVEYKDTLEANWELLRAVVGNGDSILITDNGSVTSRFYRIKLGQF